MNIRRSLFLSLLLLFVSFDASGQTKSKFEIGAQFTTLTLFPCDFCGDMTEPGFGGRVTYNINDNVAVEAEANFFPNDNVFQFLGEGRALQAQFGVKVGKRFKKFGIFGKARPGVLSVGDVFSFQPGTTNINGFPFPNTRIGREHYFTMDVGGVLEFYPSPKTIVRFDAGDTIVRYGSRLEPDPFTFPNLVTVPGRVTHNLQITAGVGFRLGTPDSSTVPTPSNGSASDVPRYEVGAHFTSMSTNPPRTLCSALCISSPDTGPITEPGLGGRFTLNVHRNIGFEAEFNYFTRDQNQFIGRPAGHMYQGQFGVKAGKRFERFGLFGKFRPGFVGFSRTSQLIGTEILNIGGFQFPRGIFKVSRKEYLSFDAGGVIEFYVSRRLMTRMDFGDTIIKYGEFHFPSFFLSIPFVRREPETRHNFQFNAGLGFRF